MMDPRKLTPGWATFALTVAVDGLALAFAVGILWMRVGSVEDAQRAGELRLQARIERVETILLSRSTELVDIEVD